METLVLATFRSDGLNVTHEFIFRPKKMNELEIHLIIKTHLDFIQSEISNDFKYCYYNLIGSYSTSK